MDNLIPFYSLKKMHEDLKNELKATFDEVINDGWFILGDQLEKFEKKFAEFVQVKYAVGVGNGYDGLKIALRALEFTPEDEIIIPAFTFSASILAALEIHIKPVLVDVDTSSYVIDPDKVAGKITARTRAIMPVHLYGNPCEMGTLAGLAKKHDLFIIEDFAQSVGALYLGQPVGSFGNINATSFYPVKPLGGLGDGGMITTNDLSLRNKCIQLRNYGYGSKYQLDVDGYNSRLDEIQAAFLLRKLKYLEKWNLERKQIADRYIRNLSNIEQIRLPSNDPKRIRVYHIFPILTRKRNDLHHFLNSKGIQTQIHYPIPPHLQPALKFLGYQQGHFPVTENICNQELSLPIYPGLKMGQVDFISEMIQAFIKGT